MGATSSRKLSNEHMQALEAFSSAQMRAMEAHFASVCGPKHTTIEALLGIPHASDQALTAIMGSLQAVANENAKGSKVAAPGLPDIILLKYSLERASKRQKCQSSLSMFPPSPSQKVRRAVEQCGVFNVTCSTVRDVELLFNVFHAMGSTKMLQDVHEVIVALLQAFCPAAADAHSKQLASITAFIHPFMTDSMSLEKGAKSWPGLLALCASVTAHFPPAHSLRPLDTEEAEHIPAAIAPPAFVMSRDASGNELLGVAARMALASLLKKLYQKKWHMLFNSYVHGKSYAMFYGKIASKGPTLTIVKDKKGHVFGGFAADSWEKHGTYYGSSTCFLFTLLPTFQVFFASGVNSNFQWCGYKFSQLPNGVGFGGQVGYFSLLIEDSLDTGMSRPAATYGSPSLASSEKFEIDQVEVWLVAEPEEDLQAGPGGTAIDKFKEDKHLLEVAGVQMHSDGYRDRPPEPIS